jgi:NAD(P)-dependent dehydrogenase (short-subunit alcohol dehydrogenase family)
MNRFFFKGPISEVMVEDRDLVDNLEDSIFIVTGANSSLGKIIVGLLMNRGAKVIRTVKSSEDLRKDEYICDMSDPKQIFDFCEKFKEKYSKLNGIINLASGLYGKYATNDLGIEKTFATNVIAPYLLFKNLLPLIKSTGGVRFLNVINPLMLTVKMKPENLDSKAMYYARDTFLQCERYRIELWHHLADEYPEVRFHCMIPGFVWTWGLKKKFPFFFDKYAFNLYPFRILRKREIAAMLILWGLLTPKISSMPNGALIFDKAVQKEYILKENKTLIEEHKMFISNFYKILELNAKDTHLNIQVNS